MARKPIVSPAFDPLGENFADALVETVGPNKSTTLASRKPSEKESPQFGTDASVFSSMVENSPTALILADKEFNITYINPAMKKGLERIAEHLPIPIDEVVGANIDVFHEEPARQRRVLADPKNLPYEARIEIGDEIATLLVSPIYDHMDNYSGPMVTWNFITDEVRLEAERSRITSMVENSPTAVILADKEFNITYINPAMKKALERIAEHLPIPIDEVVGANIDVFHEEPARQRRVLADPKNLPYEARIEIGDEIATLLVSPIYDHMDNYSGPMVTWNFITDEVRLEAERSRITSMVENSPSALILADTEFNITYINPAMRKAFERIAEHLPIPIDEVVGLLVLPLP